MNYQSILNQYLTIKAESKLLNQKIEQNQKRIADLEEELKINDETQQILFQSIKIINQEFKEKLETMATIAIKKIFQRNLELKVEYVEKAYGIETRLLILENSLLLDLQDDMGGSIIEVISLIIRLILRDMAKSKSRKTIILDEPFRWAGRLIELIAQIIKEFSVQYNLQFIIFTHDEALEDIADRIFKIDRQDKISKVTIIK